MREGDNISRDKPIEIKPCNHRVIIPLHIPHEKDYYKDAFSIFKMCLTSVNKTSTTLVKVSVVSNCSSEIINTKLTELFKEGLINELIIEREAIGKLNSIFKVVRTSNERFLTITDADIMFLNNWETNVMEVFENFPKAAAVSPMPVFRTQNHYTSNVIFDYLFSKKIQFSEVKNPDGLTKFAKSIGWKRLDEKWKDVIMTISSKNNKVKAVVGCNHSIVTYKREIFESAPKQLSKYKLGGDSEGLYLDQPSMFYDGYRLATHDNFAHHLGNKVEPWMLDTFNRLEHVKKEEIQFKAPLLKKSIFKHVLKNVIFKKIIARKAIRKKYYLNKGLEPAKVENFI